MKAGVMEEVRKIFKPEFLNRIDEIMVFHTLKKEDIQKIVSILLKKLEKRCQEQMNITPSGSCFCKRISCRIRI